MSALLVFPDVIQESCRVLVRLFLLLPRLLIGDACAETLREGIESLDLAVLVQPVLLPDSGTLFGCNGHRPGLFDCFIELGEKFLIVVPTARIQSLAGGVQKQRVIFAAVLHQQFQPLTILLFARNQLPQLTRCLIEPQC